MNDRGMIKWEPFNSVAPSSRIISDVMNEKNKVKKPILSEDQLHEIEKRLMEAFSANIEIDLVYYENGYLRTILDKIKKIDYVGKKIYLLSKIIYFNQILSVN